MANVTRENLYLLLNMHKNSDKAMGDLEVRFEPVLDSTYMFLFFRSLIEF